MHNHSRMRKGTPGQEKPVGARELVRLRGYPNPHWLRFVPRTLNLGVRLNLTQTPIGFVPFHGQSTSVSDSILPRPPLASFRSTDTEPRCRTQSYPDLHWLRFVPRALHLGVGLNLTQAPTGFVPLRGEWEASSVEHGLRRTRIRAQDWRRIEKEQRAHEPPWS